VLVGVGLRAHDERPAGAMLRRAGVSGARWNEGSAVSASTRRRKKFFRENTIDLQWQMRANYNARLCASSRKAAGARTMENNGKNNAMNNRKQSDIRTRADVGS
jgi:hypothetical protein